MGEVLLRAHLHANGVDARVQSAGTTAWGGGATAHAIEVMRDRGLDLSGHSSRQLEPAHIADADLVIAMTRNHLWRVCAVASEAAERTFLLGELARLGQVVGRRRDAEGVREWAARVAATRGDVRVAGRMDDEVADPVGEPVEVYRSTADRLDRDLRTIATLLAPD
jgi:protein-tyrosine-phosphatase